MTNSLRDRASSGRGAAFANGLTVGNNHLVLVARSEDKLKKIAKISP